MQLHVDFCNILNNYIHSSHIYPQGEINDEACIVALGNVSEVILLKVTPKNYEIIMRASKPKSYYNKYQDKLVDLNFNSP